MDEGFLGFLYFKTSFNPLDFSGTSQPFLFIDPLCWPWIEQVEGSYPYLRSLGYYVDPHLLYKSQVKFQCILLVQQTDLLSFYSHQIYLCPNVSTVGWAPWNLSCLKFKFDDTRLSYWHNNKIGRIETFFCCFLTLLILCPVRCLNRTEQAKWAEN